ncbi:MAG TPA: hypothetical protein VGH20_22375 [Myxococcales bacterium]
MPIRLIGLAAAAALALFLRTTASARRPVVQEAVDEPPLFPPEVSRPFSFGMRSLVADVTFLQAVQVHGGRKSNVTAGERTAAADDHALARLLDYATELDPRFCGAYRYTGSALPRHTLDGKVTGVVATETILRRGTRECPDDWRISFMLGFIESFYLGKMDAAATAMADAARHPDAPRYVAFLATRLAADAGAVDLGEQLAAAMEAEASEDATRTAWHERLLDLRMERHARELQAAVDHYKKREGRLPRNLEALIAAGDLRQIPPEPHGGHWSITPDGEIASSAAPRLRIRGRVGTQSGLLAQ